MLINSKPIHKKNVKIDQIELIMNIQVIVLAMANQTVATDTIAALLTIKTTITTATKM